MWHHRQSAGNDAGVSSTSPSPNLRAGGVVAAGAFAPGVWLLIGPYPDTGPVFMSRAPEFPNLVEVAAGVSLLVIVGAVSVWAFIQHRRRRFPAAWWKVGIYLALAGLVLGAGNRVLSTGGEGANIGGGWVILLGAPIIIMLLVAARRKTTVLLSGGRQTYDQALLPNNAVRPTQLAIGICIVGLIAVVVDLISSLLLLLGVPILIWMLIMARRKARNASGGSTPRFALLPNNAVRPTQLAVDICTVGLIVVVVALISSPLLLLGVSILIWMLIMARRKARNASGGWPVPSVGARFRS